CPRTTNACSKKLIRLRKPREPFRHPSCRRSPWCRESRTQAQPSLAMHVHWLVFSCRGKYFMRENQNGPAGSAFPAKHCVTARLCKSCLTWDTVHGHSLLQCQIRANDARNWITNEGT